MAGRGLAFADPEIIQILRSSYVPVTGDDWYRRRQQDAVGAFFRNVADQGPRKGEDGSTRQGLYCFTAAGTLLAYRNSFDPTAVKALLKEGLDGWAKLPEAERRPRPFAADRGMPDAQFAREVPEGGLVLRVHARELEEEAKGRYRAAAPRGGRPNQASLDHLWLKKEEWPALLPPRAEAGARYPMPPAVVRRLVRFHLIDNTRGEPPMWEAGDVRKADVALTIDGVKDGILALWLSGEVLLETAEKDRGYEASLTGFIGYDLKASAFKRFDVVAIGMHWGEGRYTPGARPGRTPLGVAFALADGKQEADKIPPQAGRDIGAYYGRD